ncbi:hypothetical protein LJC63_10745 [Ruminococcaceae bacterium OttesenSCG-928-L11]|nr:hypothetical protein [Ruminococcaceae bacterium OttesenSCG-928-L11]
MGQTIWQNGDICLHIDGTHGELEVRLPAPAVQVSLTYRSGRNRTIPLVTDASERQPESERTAPVKLPEQECWLPVVDVAVTPGMYGRVAVQKQAGGSYAWNGHLFPARHPVEDTLHIPGQQLLDWENVLWFSRRDNAVTEFALVQTYPHLPSTSLAFQRDIAFLTDCWYGEIQVSATLADGQDVLVGAVTVAEHYPAGIPSAADGLNRNALTGALRENLRYILDSRVHSANSPSRDGFYLFYDMDARTYRNAFWPWGWGPAIRALLDSGEIPEIAAEFDPDTLKTAAYRAGKASLRYMVEAPGHITHHLSTSRYDPNPLMDGGVRERICCSADGGFLCGWAWLPLYRATGDERFLTAAKHHADRVEELCREFGVPPQDYAGETKAFTAHTLDESGFGTEAFEALFRETGDTAYQELSRRYMDLHVEKFRREDGLWQRLYHRPTDSAEESIYMTRGLGWAMEGLLCTHRTMAGTTDRYLQQAREMADQLLRYQRPDGAWNFRFNQPEEDVGIGEKGVALWSLLFYQLHRETGDPAHLSAARKALGWCMRNQQTGGTAGERGAVPGISPQSAVVYRKWYKIACLYTAGFFALALLEELKLHDTDMA